MYNNEDRSLKENLHSAAVPPKDQKNENLCIPIIHVYLWLSLPAECPLSFTKAISGKAAIYRSQAA